MNPSEYIMMGSDWLAPLNMKAVQNNQTKAELNWTKT